MFVVGGAPTAYWTRDWLSWSEEGQTEQWPYRVKFHQTNVYGKTNNNTYPSGINGIMADETTQPRTSTSDDNIYTLTGHLIRRGSTSTVGLAPGIYIVRGRKVLVR